MKNEKVKELATNISDYVNVMSRDNDLLIGLLANEHRTLQQSFTRFCVQWLEHMASLPDSRIDLRNEASRDIARKMLQGEAINQDYGDTPSDYIPLV